MQKFCRRTNNSQSNLERNIHSNIFVLIVWIFLWFNSAFVERMLIIALAKIIISLTKLAIDLCGFAWHKFYWYYYFSNFIDITVCYLIAWKLRSNQIPWELDIIYCDKTNYYIIIFDLYESNIIIIYILWITTESRLGLTYTHIA